MMQGLLPRKLRLLRAERALSLSDAAERAGVTRDTLSELERGKRHPHAPTLTKIAAGYGVELSELLDLEEPARGKALAPSLSGA
jgi:transcriptional regulator with XRE-family HTH domain